MKQFCLGLVVLCGMVWGVRTACAEEFKGTLGQSSLSLAGDWQFHTGDDMRWAQPGFDDSKWETISTEKPWGAQGHSGYTGFAWYRRAVELEGVVGQVSIYVPQVDNAYEIYWNGQQIGGYGKLPPYAEWNQEAVSNVFFLPHAKASNARLAGVLAIRVWKAMNGTVDSVTLGGLRGEPRIGVKDTLTNQLALEEALRERQAFFYFVESAVLGLIGATVLGLWLVDRSRRLYPGLGLFFLGLACYSAFEFPNLGRMLSFRWEQLIVAFVFIARDLGIWMLILVLFGLDSDRFWRRLSAAVAAVYCLSYVVELSVVWLWAAGWQTEPAIDRVATLFNGFLPAYLIVLLFAGLRRRRELALLPFLFACTALELYVLITSAIGEFVEFTGASFETIYRFGAIRVGPYALDLATELQAVVLVTLVWTVYREQARERRRQVFVEAEMKSAHEVQSVLVPEETPAVPGFSISSLYWPAGEVGGDMFQVLPDEEGGVLVVIADVSGKGLKAAMTVSLLVGAVRTFAETTTDPMAILAGLNRRLMGRVSGGFSTCLVLHVSSAGAVTMANAGHLAPFVNGEAIELEGSLPLGIVYDTEFTRGDFWLREGDEVSLYTDGVLEAQRADGELFGFERTAALMRTRPSAQAIAEAAKAFGQEDDITVVKIVRIRAQEGQEEMSVDLRTVTA